MCRKNLTTQRLNKCVFEPPRVKGGDAILTNHHNFPAISSNQSHRLDLTSRFKLKRGKMCEPSTSHLPAKMAVKDREKHVVQHCGRTQKKSVNWQHFATAKQQQEGQECPCKYTIGPSAEPFCSEVTARHDQTWYKGRRFIDFYIDRL